MSKIVDQNYLLTEQYRDAANLNARVQLHARYSTNKQGWLQWVFEQLDLPARCRILELGSGPGNLWAANAHRIPESWDITLSDFSPGMLSEAQHKLANCHRQFHFEQIDAQSIPYENASFDAVIANHMLYHVPEKTKALGEIQRILKPHGRLFATTVGKTHLQELSELLTRFNPEFASWGGEFSETFTLESGLSQLARWFPKVILRRYEDSLQVTEPVPLIDYVLSSLKMNQETRLAFARFVADEMQARGGTMRITKDSGLFEAWQSRKPIVSYSRHD